MMEAPGKIKETSTKSVCNLCLNEFGTLTQLVWHQKQKHNANMCEFCGFVATSSMLLRGHVNRSHRGSNPYNCVCLARFTCDEDLKNHSSVCPKILNSQLSAVERTVGLGTLDSLSNGATLGQSNSAITLPPYPVLSEVSLTGPMSSAGAGLGLSSLAGPAGDGYTCVCQQVFTTMEELMEHAIYCLKPTTCTGSNSENNQEDKSSSVAIKIESLETTDVNSSKSTEAQDQGAAQVATTVKPTVRPESWSQNNGSNTNTGSTYEPFVARTTKIGGSTKRIPQGNPKRDSQADGSTKLGKGYPECKLMVDWMKCKICFLSFKNQDKLKEHHQVRHKEGGPFCCAACGVAFSTTIQLEHHACREDDDVEHYCGECGQEFDDTDRAQHVKQHAELIKPCYVCFVCNWATNDADKILLHKRSTSCFNTSRQAVRLTAQSAPQDHQVSICAICGLLLTSSFSFSRHLHAMHSHTQLYQCSKCTSVFKHRRHAALHQRCCQGQQVAGIHGDNLQVLARSKCSKALKIQMRKLPYIYL